jgi:transcriptional regulator with XRE-family HTH domain
MSANFAYLATSGKDNFCLFGRGGILPVGQNRGMPDNRLKELREAAGMTLEVLSEQVDLSVSYIQRLENGSRNLALKHLDAFAEALKVTPRDILAVDGLVEAASSTIVNVVGRIGAGAEILPEMEQVPPDGLFQIEVPFPVPEGTLAFEIDGDSMWPRYDHKDVILCWGQGTNMSEVIGWEAAVRTSEGRRFLKRVVKGGKAKTYDLESFNAPVIRNVKLEWISKVQLVVRAGEWKQLSQGVQRRISKKLAASR